ncbi:hypothetical protein [Agaribacterium haliotis]|uniref:hypothetical protein n=1 Tax=Agaribacterium haliotis TaxID=2013869 RepID=UPI000BB53631|nr:hypothetical protein [Agaribacterium haliotis]
MKIRTVSLLALLSLSAPIVTAQSADIMQSLTQSNVNLEQQISANQQEIEKYKAKADAALADLDASKQELERAVDDQRRAKATYRTQPTAENKRAVDRADGAFNLAERKLASLQKRADYANSKVDELNKASLAAQAEIEANQRSIIEIEKALDNKKRMEQQAKREQARAKAEALASAEAAKKQAPSPEPEPEPSLSIEAEEAQARLAELESYLTSGVKERGKLTRLKGSAGSNSFRFEHLGGEIYRAETKLDAGEHKVKVGRSLFKVVIEEEYAGEAYTFYYDHRNERKARLMTFRSVLLVKE